MDLERYCATAWGFCSQAPRREPPLVRTPSTGFVLRLTSRKGWVLRWLELDFGCDAGDPAEPAGDAPAACLRAFTCPIAGHVAQPGKMINAASVALFRGVGRLSAADAEKLIFLWLHESERVYADSLISLQDQMKYQNAAAALAKRMFTKFSNIGKYMNA